MEEFSIKEALSFGWKKTRAHSGLLFRVMLTFFVLEVATSIVQQVLKGTFLGAGASIVLGVLGVFVGTGFILIVLKISEGHEASYADLFPHWRVVWRCFVASIVAGVIVMLGLIALIIPGIYLLLRYSMVRFVVLQGPAQREGHFVGEVLRKSSELTEGVKWRLLGFFLVYLLINLVGAALLLIGLLVTVPVTTIAFAHIYRQLKSRRHVEAK